MNTSFESQQDNTDTVDTTNTTDPKYNNPLGTLGFEFVEFTGQDQALLKRQMVELGFQLTGRHRSKNVLHYSQGEKSQGEKSQGEKSQGEKSQGEKSQGEKHQGQINFILNFEPSSRAEQFAEKHGQSANAMAFRVQDAAAAIKEAEKRGAKVVQSQIGPMELNIPAIEGIGGLLIYLVDNKNAKSIYEVDFEPINPASLLPEDIATSANLYEIDHLTHNLYRGNMDLWATFYQDIFNFRQIHFFDIAGKHTALFSRAMTSPCGKIRIPLNESQDENSQIEEFLHKYGGEGIQHIALSTRDINNSVTQLRSNGVLFQSTPNTYYEMVDGRVPGHGEDIKQLQANHILIDGNPEEKKGILLQIFTQEAVGPIFFEIIQRKGNQGFGEGNFKALFESIEQDQIRRGVLETSTDTDSEG